MYNFLLTMQYIGVFILIAEFAYIFNQKPSKQQSLIYLFVISALFNSIGYLFELQATMRETALMAVKFTYMGKVYILLCMFIFLMEYCEITYSKIIQAVLFLLHTFVALLVLTCERHTLYYKAIEFTSEGLFPHLILVPGIAYYAYLVLTGFYLVLTPLFILYRYRNSVDSDKKNQLIFFLILVMLPGFSLLVYLTGKTGGYDTTAMGYVLCSIIFLFSIFQHNLFDTLDLAKEYVVENMTNGIIVLGSSNQLLHANGPAKNLFPELAERHPKKLIEQLFAWAEDKEYRFIDSHVYTCHICNIYGNNILRGKMITIDDVTIHYNYTKELENAVNEKTHQLEQTQHAVISSFANLIEARDGITGEHVKRTSAYVRIITHALKENGYYTDILTDRYIKALINAAPLHDIGKIAIPDSILRKPGRLTDNEYDIIKQHAKLGAEIIEDLIDEAGPEYYLIIARNMALYHHEKWDGTGYPTGLANEEIPLCARIMAISDVYDALISNRSYKKSFPLEDALKIIEEGAGKHFDPIIAKVFLDSIDQITKVHLT